MSLYVCLALAATLANAREAALERVPVLTRAEGAPAADWLVTTTPARAGVYRTADDRRLVLTNGLIRRDFLLAPNGATVAFDNLITGEALLRAVRPEARITVNGVTLNVGGLHGQPDHAYLTDAWVDALRADPGAMRLVGFETGAPVAPFAWKRVRHHAAGAQWPPAGAALRLDYAMPTDLSAFEDRLAPPASGEGRETLCETDFGSMDAAWTVTASGALAGSSFVNEGKPGEIATGANTATYAERTLPTGARLVELRLDPGTDRSCSWGPGLALVWADRVIKLNYRSMDAESGQRGEFGVNDGRTGESLVGFADGRLLPDRPLSLRLRIVGPRVLAEASPDGAAWVTLRTIEWGGPVPDPASVRVGKMDTGGGGADYGEPGERVRLKLLRFAAFGAMSEEAAERRSGELARLRDLRVSVHYEMYDGVPVLAKWISVHNGADSEVRLDSFTSEILAAVEHESLVGSLECASPPNLHVECDFEFHGDSPANASEAVHWIPDPEYTTQVNYLLQAPVLLECRPRLGPAMPIGPGESFESFRTFEMPFDTTERERKGLALRRMYRTVAPWVTENPILMHSRNSDPAAVKLCIDQCAEVGFEMVILTFWSGFDMENTDPAYLAGIRELADYAHAKGIELGGYSLLASRSIGPETDVISPKTGLPGDALFGSAPCLESAWGQEYFGKLTAFVETTGLDLIEHDGSYPGDVCASTEHPGHRGLEDSQWRQWLRIRDFYRWCRARGVSLNVPDWYFLNGSTKSGMGYRESNWSLPRDLQVIHGRQNIYDGTWEKTPSMGWMFVPLVEYQGGGAAATLEPLSEHLDAYGAHLAQNFGAGVQACYRGPRLYDTDATKAVVKQWVDFYKAHRAILDSDLVHVRRADGRHIDGFLHVNPGLAEKGLAMLFNPTDETVRTTVRLPLYYTGLTETARVSEQDGEAVAFALGRDHSIELPVTIGPRGLTWFVLR